MKTYHRTYIITFTTKRKGTQFYAGKHTSMFADPSHDPYKGSGVVVKRAITKYGTSCVDSIVWFDHESEDSMIEAEVELIETMKALHGDLCVNLHEGGRGGNTRKYMSDAQVVEYNLAIKQSLNSDGVQARKVSTLAKTNSDPEVKRKRSMSAKAMHTKASVIENRKAAYSSQATRTKMSESAKRSYENTDKLDKLKAKKRTGLVWQEPMYSKLLNLWLTTTDGSGERLKHVNFTKTANSSGLFDVTLTAGKLNRLVSHFFKEHYETQK